jgi:very-short-patch-repair endonuclease
MGRETLTPTLSRQREREQEVPGAVLPGRNKEGAVTPGTEQAEASDSLSRVRERAGVRARALRQRQTDAEALLWSRLRNRQLGGMKFRRQHPLAGYFADLVCIEARLVVELDGGQHADQTGYDSARSQAMASDGSRTLRFWNNDVLNNTDGVLQAILTAAGPHPTPLPQAGEGAKTRSS